MANIKLIGINGKRIVPHGSGWEVDNIFFPDWTEAVQYAKEDSKIVVMPSRAKVHDRRLLFIAILVALMVIAAALAS